MSILIFIIIALPIVLLIAFCDRALTEQFSRVQPGRQSLGWGGDSQSSSPRPHAG